MTANKQELGDLREKAWSLLFDELDTVQMLRDHVPVSQRHLVDRLESTLRLIAGIEDWDTDEDEDLWDEL